MKLTLAATVMTLLLTGCAADVLQSSRNMVQVNHFSNPAGLSSAMEVASNACAKHNRVAMLDRQTCPGMNCVTQFRCEDK